MQSDVPTFRRVKRSYAARLIHGALINERGAALLELIEFDDRHYRAVFSRKYFQPTAGHAGPSKSQWNTLKKKLKRRDRSIFVFREHGVLDGPPGGSGSKCFLDFGFLRM